MLFSWGVIQFKVPGAQRLFDLLICHCSGNSFSDMRIRHKIYKSRNYGRIPA